MAYRFVCVTRLEEEFVVVIYGTPTTKASRIAREDFGEFLIAGYRLIMVIQMKPSNHVIEPGKKRMRQIRKSMMNNLIAILSLGNLRMTKDMDCLLHKAWVISHLFRDNLSFFFDRFDSRQATRHERTNGFDSTVWSTTASGTNTLAVRLGENHRRNIGVAISNEF